MKKKYIIVGDNNFWYVSTDEITEDELVRRMGTLKKDIQDGVFDDNEPSRPNELFAFEGKQIARLEL